MTDDDLTTAYILGVEYIRDKMHKQADEIERLRADNVKILDGMRDTIQERDILSGENYDLRAENEKLREALIGLYKPVFENPVEVGSNLDLALRAAASAIRESWDE